MLHSAYSYRIPQITTPNGSYILPLLQDAFVIAIVTFSVTVSLAKVFARQFSYTVDSNQVHCTYKCYCERYFVLVHCVVFLLGCTYIDVYKMYMYMYIVRFFLLFSIFSVGARQLWHYEHSWLFLQFISSSRKPLSFVCSG